MSKPKPETIGASAILGCGFLVMRPFAEAWVLMVVLGVVHATVAAAVPAVGYMAAVGLVAGVYLLTTFIRRLFRK